MKDDRLPIIDYRQPRPAELRRPPPPPIPLSKETRVFLLVVVLVGLPVIDLLLKARDPTKDMDASADAFFLVSVVLVACIMFGRHRAEKIRLAKKKTSAADRP